MDVPDCFLNKGSQSSVPYAMIPYSGENGNPGAVMMSDGF
jgi:hypothetical protein